MRCTRTLTCSGRPAWRCVWTPSLWTTGAWLAIPPHHQPVSLSIPKRPTPGRQGCVSEDKLLSAVKQLGTMDVTHEETQYIRLSVCLRDRDAHGYASFFCLNGSTDGKAGRKALCRFQNAGARWALGTESQVPTETESSPTLPTRVL